MNRTSFEAVENLDSPKRVEAFVQLATTGKGKDIVVKTVIGPSPGWEVDRRANASELDDVNEIFADPLAAWRKTSIHGLDNIDWQSFGNLTHLYIWSISGLTKVGRLPEKLECLDLRGCAELKSLPDELPKTLENLDLEGCVALEKLPESLPDSLTEVYLGGCRQLKVFKPVRDLINSQFSPVWDNTASSDGVTPSGIHRLELHGCIFDDLDRSLCGDAGENVIGYVRRFLEAIHKQGKALLPECKVVVLGDGGAGKTSLIRALKDLPFQNNEEATDKIRCWNWDDGVRNPFGSPEKPTINVWDFAGQQLYHATHRMFLESRAVFVVVWRTPPKDGGPNRQECADDVRHDLNYWLDQIYAANDNPSVILVRTRRDEDAHNPPDPHWGENLREPYKHFADKDSELSFEVSTTDEGRKTTLPDLKTALKNAIERQMGSLGANDVPAGWKALRGKLANLQPRWQDEQGQPLEHATQLSPVMPLSDFFESVVMCYRENNFPEPTDAEVRDILRYFHDIGAVYCPRRWRDQWQTIPQPHVIIDQRWAIATVYQLTANRSVQAHLRADKGVVRRTMLSALWEKVLNPNRESAQIDNRERAPERCGSLPDNLWAIEQMMLTAGILVELPMMLAGQQQFVFPDYLPARKDVEEALKSGKDVEEALKSGKTMFKELLSKPGPTFFVTGLNGDPIPSEFDYSFAARMIARSYQGANDTEAFRYGVVTPWELKSKKLDGQHRLAIVIEWHPPLSTNGCGLTFTIYGGVPDDIDLGDSGRRWFSGWIERVRPGSVRRLSLSTEGGGSRRVAASQGDSSQFSVPSAPSKNIITIGISYAAKDDRFHRAFINELRQELTQNAQLKPKFEAKCLEIYDYAVNGRCRTTTGMTAQVSGAEIFIGVISHRYLASMTCMSEMLRAAHKHTCSTAAPENIQEKDIQTMFDRAGGPPWGPLMRVVRLPSTKPYLSDFGCEVTPDGYVRKRWYFWPMRHARDGVAADAWAKSMYQKAVDAFSGKQLSRGLGVDAIKEHFIENEYDGRWIVATVNVGQEISGVWRCLAEQNYPEWQDVNPKAIGQRAKVLANDVAEIVDKVQSFGTVQYQMRHFAEEAAEAGRTNAEDAQALDYFARVMELGGVDANEVQNSAKTARDLFGDEVVADIANVLEAVRGAYVRQYVSVQGHGP